MPRLPKGQEDFQVIVSLKKLLELMESAERADELTDKVESLDRQQTALRGQFLELMEKFKELQ